MPEPLSLLPCPGCGSPAALRPYRGVRCSNDACWWEVDGYGCDPDATLAAQWNQRAQPTPKYPLGAKVALYRYHDGWQAVPYRVMSRIVSESLHGTLITYLVVRWDTDGLTPAQCCALPADEAHVRAWEEA